ncbi:MAG: hypothetical protein O2783_04090 [Chloroflexi bacterium]|nr:hypothetical protein [Chloroflexota bacterium]
MKRLTTNEEDPVEAHATARRGWAVSLGLAAVIVSIGIGLSAVINPLLGRYVHWDWVAGLASALFVALTIALRRRWL